MALLLLRTQWKANAFNILYGLYDIISLFKGGRLQKNSLYRENKPAKVHNFVD